MNDWTNTMFDCWRHGAKISFVEYLGYYLVNVYYAFGESEETRFLHSEFCEALWFYITLVDVMEDINGERHEFLIEEQEEDAEWLVKALGYENEPFIECPHCRAKIYAKNTIYSMMRGFNISQDTCTLECPSCKAEIKSYGYNEYYAILGM